jgi:hypothetical protein
VEKINNWFQGKERLAEYRVISQYITWNQRRSSQYWVAPFIQDIFDNVVTPRRPDIAAAIKANSAMQLS